MGARHPKKLLARIASPHGGVCVFYSLFVLGVVWPKRSMGRHGALSVKVCNTWPTSLTSWGRKNLYLKGTLNPALFCRKRNPKHKSATQKPMVPPTSPVEPVDISVEQKASLWDKLVEGYNCLPHVSIREQLRQEECMSFFQYPLL